MKKNFSINANNYFTIKLFVRGSKLIRTFIHISFGIKKSDKYKHFQKKTYRSKIKNIIMKKMTIYLPIKPSF